MTQTADTNAPIDVVYTWVDGEQNAALREQLLSSSPGSRAENTSNRYRDNSELRHSIASVRTFAPWVRNIFIATADGQRPSWYSAREIPDVRIVHHTELFGESSHLLPVFNSHAIESVLHRIPGLAERFIYFNDDMFLGAPVEPEDFFTPEGRAVIRTAQRITKRWPSHGKSWRVYRGNVRNVLEAAHGPGPCYNTAHQARALLRSSCEGCWSDDTMGPKLHQTMASRFRCNQDIAPIELYANEILRSGNGVRSTERGFALCVLDHSHLRLELAALRLLSPRFYCINDDMRAPSPRHLEELEHLFASLLPHNGGPPRSRRVSGTLLLAWARLRTWSRSIGVQHEQPSAQNDSDVCDIEHRPPVDVHEVDHVAPY